MARKVCVITGSRAEYSQLYRLLTKVQTDSRLILQLIVTGMHLSEEYGSTVDAIVDDGFKITAIVETLTALSSSSSIAEEIAKGLVGITNSLIIHQPDVVVVLGDRYEILPAAISALFQKIPLVHICGGERTDGSLDESVRHSITKMAQIHFVSDEVYRRRVIQMGEAPSCVLNYGDLGIENIRNTKPQSRESLAKEYGRQILSPYFLVTYHPETANSADPAFGADRLVEILNSFSGYSALITGANSDKGGENINRIFKKFCTANPGNVIFVENLGREKYISAMHYCAVVIGNSSSGVVEAPVIGIPTVNIGERQSGRLMKESIISCSDNCQSISEAIKLALSKEFKEQCVNMVDDSPRLNTAEEMTNYLANADLVFRGKIFHDLQTPEWN